MCDASGAEGVVLRRDGRVGVPDRYVDAFCGRVPGSILAKRYSDFAPEKLKEIYEKNSIKIPI